MSIERALEQIDTRTQEVPGNWHAGKGLSDGVTWGEVREWLATLAGNACTCGAKQFGPPEEDCTAHGAKWARREIELPCNCDNGEAYGHHRWCDSYRPPGMSDAVWESNLEEAHPLRTSAPASPVLRMAKAEAWDEGSRSSTYPDGSLVEVARHAPTNPYRIQ